MKFHDIDSISHPSHDKKYESSLTFVLYSPHKFVLGKGFGSKGERFLIKRKIYAPEVHYFPIGCGLVSRLKSSLVLFENKVRIKRKQETFKQ